MLDHLGLDVTDYDRSRAFYETALAPLGITLIMEPIPGVGGFGDAGKPYFWIGDRGRPRSPACTWPSSRLARAGGRVSRGRDGRRRDRQRRPRQARDLPPATTTARSCWTPTATTSKPSATARLRPALRRYPAPCPSGSPSLLMAAGRGTRMRSSLPKVLHPVCGRPMVEWVIDAARAAGADEHRLHHPARRRRGRRPARRGRAWPSSARARAPAPPCWPRAPAGADERRPWWCCPATAARRAELIESLVDAHARAGAAATLLTTEELDPAGYGRIVRAPTTARWSGSWRPSTPRASSPSTLAIREINIGTYVFEAAELWPALDEVGTEHGERYLTGVFPLLRERGRPVVATRPPTCAAPWA